MPGRSAPKSSSGFREHERRYPPVFLNNGQLELPVQVLYKLSRCARQKSRTRALNNVLKGRKILLGFISRLEDRSQSFHNFRKNAVESAFGEIAVVSIEADDRLTMSRSSTS